MDSCAEARRNLGTEAHFFTVYTYLPDLARVSTRNYNIYSWRLALCFLCLFLVSLCSLYIQKTMPPIIQSQLGDVV